MHAEQEALKERTTIKLAYRSHSVLANTYDFKPKDLGVTFHFDFMFSCCFLHFCFGCSVWMCVTPSHKFLTSFF
jgi:hypothetical protein